MTGGPKLGMGLITYLVRLLLAREAARRRPEDAQTAPCGCHPCILTKAADDVPTGSAP